MHSKPSLACPVCGFAELDGPPYDELGCPTYEICPCCGTEFGYDDFLTSHAALRERRISKGMPWWSSRQQPPIGWDPHRQLQEAGFAG
jgi:hypothetical protein